MSTATTAAKPKKTRNTFVMPQRLTTDGDVSVTQVTDYVVLSTTGHDEGAVKLSEYNATRLLRMLAEHLKVALPAGVVDKIKKAEPREPRKQ